MTVLILTMQAAASEARHVTVTILATLKVRAALEKNACSDKTASALKPLAQQFVTQLMDEDKGDSKTASLKVSAPLKDDGADDEPPVEISNSLSTLPLIPKMAHGCTTIGRTVKGNDDYDPHLDEIIFYFQCFSAGEIHIENELHEIMLKEEAIPCNMCRKVPCQWLHFGKRIVTHVIANYQEESNNKVCSNVSALKHIVN